MRVFLLLLFTIAAISCKKKPLIEPCNPNEPFVADFKVGENLYSYGLAETDTIIKFSFVAKAADTYTSYKWTIGNDSRGFTGSSVGLSFTLADIGKTIPVKLIATGKAKNDCLTSADKTDTVQKNITVLYPRNFGYDTLVNPAYIVDLPFLGKWQGSFTDNPSDTFTVYIVNNGPLTSTAFTTKRYGIRVYNLPKGCGGNTETFVCGFVEPTLDYYGYPLEVSYKTFYSDDSGFLPCCPKAKLYGKISERDYNKIIIACTFYSDENGVLKETKRTFEGVRN